MPGNERPTCVKPRLASLLAIACLASCGTGPATSIVTENPSTTTVADASTTTVAADRSIPVGEDVSWCSLEGALVNASSVAHVAVDASTALQTWQPEANVSGGFAQITRSTFDFVWTDPAADIVRANVADIVAARADDPRGPSAPPTGPLLLTQQLRGSALPELWASGDDFIALIGPWGVQGNPAWQVHAALNAQPDGSLEFLGACADVFTGDLAAIAALRGVQPDLALVAELVEGALQPGAAADVRYAAAGWGFSGSPGERTPVPPMLLGKVRITGIVYVTTGSGNSTASVRSQHIISAGASVQASGGAPFALAVAYLDGHPIEVLWPADQALSSDLLDAPVAASVDPALVPNEGGLVVEIDTTSGTATLRAVGIDEFSLLSGYSVEQLRNFTTDFANGLSIDTARAEPALYDATGTLVR